MKETNLEQPRTLNAWLSYLEQLHSTTIDMGLERTQRVAEALAVQKPAPFVFVVGGTNGKGSTVSMLEHILLAAGYSVATYTSPHIVDYRERVRINGHYLSEEAHCDAFAKVEAARQATSLTYFEFSTLAALQLIQQHEVDVAILEVGLGGRLDAVNVVEPNVSIVTSVDIDHIQFLGNDRERIGFEKAGIFRPNCVAICGDPDVPKLLLEHAQQIAARLYCVNVDFAANQSASHWDFECANSPWRELVYPHLPFPNAITTLAALHHSGLAVSREHVITGLQTATVPGRFEIWPGEPLRILDVAHNPHAARYLAQRLREKGGAVRVLAVCGMLNDKDIRATLHEMKPVVSAWYFASLSGPRGAKAQQLAELANGAEQKCYESVKEALAAATAQAHRADVIVCFGSFYTVAAVYEAEGRIIGVE